ncbi:MAG: hypothetical protein WAV43_04485 [Streptococcus parauberis]
MKKKKSFFGKLLLALVAILAVVGIFAFYRFQTGSIEGKWTATELGDQYYKEFYKSLGSYDKEIGIEPKKMVKVPKVVMTVEDGKAEVVVKSTFDKKYLVNAIVKKFDETLKKSFSDNNVSLDDLDDETRKAFESARPKTQELEDELDKEFQKSAIQSNGEYDKATGQISFKVFSGDVNQLMHTVKVTSVNKDVPGISKNDINKNLPYELKDKKLVLKDSKKSINFKKK